MTRRVLALTAAFLAGLGWAARAICDPAPAAIVFWASDPVQPDDTVLAMGADMGNVTTVRLGRLTDAAPSTVVAWTSVKPLQITPRSVKFVIPAAWRSGLYAFRLVSGTKSSPTTLVNAPDPWWWQGDQGQAASPGGWVRVFGKSLNFGGISEARLEASGGRTLLVKSGRSDGYCLPFTLPVRTPLGHYSLFVHNGFGGNAGWVPAGTVDVKRPAVWPARIFNVMDFYGVQAASEIAKTQSKGSPAIDRTEAIQAALQKAQANGGGVVYFPEGKYALRGALQVPPHTLLRGAGMGLVALWWGKSGFALDGGSDARRLESDDPPVPPTLISGTNFGLENLSLYLPRLYQTAIDGGEGFRMQRVRIRVDRYWIRSGEREDGLTLRLGNNGRVTDCDILARGVAFAFAPGQDIFLARNQVMAGKSPLALEHGDRVIVEGNTFVSLDPTAYINVAGEGRNIYYARNRHQSLFAQQSDYSWTFDGNGGAYLGGVASVRGTKLTLAQDPAYPSWAGEPSPLWQRAAVCILAGRGAGQYRFVTGNAGREWQVDRPFGVPPDGTSVVSIVPFRGRLLLIGNHFEDAGWVNTGYGSSFDVVCANNQLWRVGALLNLGLRETDGVQPSWDIQYLNNDVYEGQTLVQTTGDPRNKTLFPGPITQAVVHRRHHIHGDNSGDINVGGNAADVVVEHCTLDNRHSKITADAGTTGILFRDNGIAQGALLGYQGSGLRDAAVLPKPK